MDGWLEVWQVGFYILPDPAIFSLAILESVKPGSVIKPTLGTY